MAVSNFNSYRSYILKRFSKPILKIPISGGFSCPNRDGTYSSNGCIFCDNVSFSPAAHKATAPVEQLSSVIKRSPRYELFIPYFQPYSNTYGTVELLQSVYEPLLSVKGVVGLAVGTRPDCFSNEIFKYLEELASRTYLSVELGLQSTHEETLKLINRGHTFDSFSKTVTCLAQSGIETVAHVMLGLPGETPAMMAETASRIAALPVTGVKIHQLMIIKGTELEQWYLEQRIDPLSIDAYAELLSTFLIHLRPDQHIHRLLADSKQRFGLIAPLWSESKDKSLAYLIDILEKNGIVQGAAYR
jgi:radical SAM protein (TIGR01212 family)